MPLHLDVLAEGQQTGGQHVRPDECLHHVLRDRPGFTRSEDAVHGDTLFQFGIIGSGGPYAQAAAKALLDNTALPAREIVERALMIAGEICIYTNQQLVIETLGPEG